MVLLIDNYDSFVHNLARYVRELGLAAQVRRNDEVTVEEALALAPSHLVLSPGPCSPAEAGISVALVRQLAGKVPVLGVCLGHQCIAAAYGGRVVRAGRPVHGRASQVVHSGQGLFQGLPCAFWATRYHSLAVESASLPPQLEVTATAADDGEVMAIAHRTLPVFGLQFHPESAGSQHGYPLLARFLGVPVEGLPGSADGGRTSLAPGADR